MRQVFDGQRAPREESALRTLVMRPRRSAAKTAAALLPGAAAVSGLLVTLTSPRLSIAISVATWFVREPLETVGLADQVAAPEPGTNLDS
jgi:hypothetical protein